MGATSLELATGAGGRGRAEAILGALPDGYAVLSADGRVLECNERFAAMAGWAGGGLVGRRPRPPWADDETQRLRDAARRAATGGGAPLELTLERADGAQVPVTVSAAPFALAPGEPAGLLCVVQDLPREEQERRRLAAAPGRGPRPAHLLDAVDASVIAVDLRGRVTHWNRGAEELYGWARWEAMGRTVAWLGILPEDPAGSMSGIADLVWAGGRWEGEIELCRRDGSRFEAQVRCAAYAGEDGEPAGVVGVSADVGERREAERRMRAARNYLRAITDSLGEGLFTLDPQGRLVYLNGTGEELLGWRQEELAGRVMHDMVHFRHADGRARPIEDCPLTQRHLAGEVVRIDDDVLIRRDGSALPVELTSAPFETEDGCCGTVVVFSDITARKAEEKRLRREIESMSWVGRVRLALAEDRFELFAQPIVELSTGAVVQHELLLRMRDEDGSLVAPGEFLPAVEEDGLIVEVDRWTSRRAIELVAAGWCVQLNLSAPSLCDPRLPDLFAAELARTGADPRRLVIEVTETGIVCDEEAASEFLTRVARLGCKVALDDFGTGYGGFSYLKRLEVDFLKIDKEFVRELATDRASQHVVRAVVALARGFGQLTVAEGVEDPETLALLRDHGVDRAQGLAIASPAPVADVLRS